jgi:hypothetical protein
VTKFHTIYQTNQHDVSKKIANSVKDNLQKVYQSTILPNFQEKKQTAVIKNPLSTLEIIPQFESLGQIKTTPSKSRYSGKKMNFRARQNQSIDA